MRRLSLPILLALLAGAGAVAVTAAIVYAVFLFAVFLWP